MGRIHRESVISLPDTEMTVSDSDGIGDKAMIIPLMLDEFYSLRSYDYFGLNQGKFVWIDTPSIICQGIFNEISELDIGHSIIKEIGYILLFQEPPKMVQSLIMVLMTFDALFGKLVMIRSNELYTIR